MALFKCKMCGGSLEIDAGVTVAECEYCGTKQTLPKSSAEVLQNLFNRANTLRLKCEFDKAEQIYEKILQEDDAEAEAHWGVVLCKYGIEYVEDPKTYKRIPTCHRTSYDAVTADADYLAAIGYADITQRSIYEAEAALIDEIQKNILSIVTVEKPFDVFLCYKETDENGRRTVDSSIANDIYYQLTQEGLKVFYAAITLENKLGMEYEPYIFAALNSAKVMLVIGTKPQYFSAIWVKNEWSRFLKLMKTDRTKLLIPCYKDMDAYDLPEEFAHLQAQDMGRIGFISDVVRGIKKVTDRGAPKATIGKEAVVRPDNTNVAPLLKRAYLFLEDGDWKSADEYCEKVLDIDPENVQAYLGKLMAGVKVRNKESLKNCKEPFASNPNYLKIVRFGDDKLKQELQEYIRIIEERNESERIERIYQNACNLMTKNQPAMYLKAAELFGSIVDYKDSALKQSECKEKAESTRKDIIYDEAKTLMRKKDIPSYEEAIVKFESISGWRDSIELAAQCKRSIEEINIKKEQDRLEAIRKAEAERTEKERAAKERKKKIIITLSSIVAIVVAIVTIVKIVNYVTYKPLSDALKEDTISVSKIKSNYTNIQNDKNALKVFEQELEICHKNNNAKKALEILTTLAECDVYFSDWVIGSDGNSDKDLSPYIQGWDTFIDWLYDETIREGTPIEKEKVIIDNGYDDSGDVTEMVEVYGFKVAAHTFDDGRVYRMYLYIPSMGWYKLDQSAKYFAGGNNIGYHRKNGGVMVD